MPNILVFAEHEAGKFKKTAFELLGKARELAAGGAVSAVVLGEAPAGELGAFGASKVYQVEGDFSGYNTLKIVRALHEAVVAANPDVILAPGSYSGKDAIPRLVARLGTGQASDCTELRLEGAEIVGRRPMYAGKLLADARISKRPAVFTVRPNSFQVAPPAGGSAEIVKVALVADAADDRVKVVERMVAEVKTANLTEAERIVSGGRALKSAENFDAIVRPLANSIRAAAGASRAASDAGYASHDEQIGQTGKLVNPQLYIAVGISGAIQHLAGMRTSKVIVAINKDPDAPIFEYSTYGVVADLFEVCPLLQQEFEALAKAG